MAQITASGCRQPHQAGCTRCLLPAGAFSAGALPVGSVPKDLVLSVMKRLTPMVVSGKMPASIPLSVSLKGEPMFAIFILQILAKKNSPLNVLDTDWSRDLLRSP